MLVTAVHFDPPAGGDKGGALLAYADVTVEGTWIIKGVRVVQSAVKVFVAMPSVEKDRRCGECNSRAALSARFCPRCGVRMPDALVDRKRWDIIHPVTIDARTAFEKQVLAFWATCPFNAKVVRR